MFRQLRSLAGCGLRIVGVLLSLCVSGGVLAGTENDDDEPDECPTIVANLQAMEMMCRQFNNATACAMLAQQRDKSSRARCTAPGSSDRSPTYRDTPNTSGQCAAGAREYQQAGQACAAGNASMCARSEQLLRAMRTLSCAIPVDATIRPGSSGDQQGRDSRTSSDGANVSAFREPVTHCVSARQVPPSKPALPSDLFQWEFRNNCGRPVHLTWYAKSGRKYGFATDLAAGEVHTHTVRQSHLPVSLEYVACPMPTNVGPTYGEAGWRCSAH